MRTFNLTYQINIRLHRSAPRVIGNSSRISLPAFTVFKQTCTYIHSWHDPKKTENLRDHSLPAYLETHHHHTRLYPFLSAYGLVDHFGLCRNRRARYVNTLNTTINSKSAAIFSPTVLETFSFSSTSLPWMMVPLFLQPAYDESSGAQLNKAGKREETDIVKIETI